MCSLHQHWNLVKQHWGGPLRALPTGLIDKLRPLTLFACWHCFAAMPHHQSVLSALDESQSDLNHEAGVSVHTQTVAKKTLSPLCPKLSMWLWHSCPWLMTVALHISEADTCCLCWPGVLSVLFCLHYSSYFSDQPSCRVHMEGGFFFHALSCPGMCNEILSSVLKTLGVPVVFTFEVFL